MKVLLCTLMATLTACTGFANTISPDQEPYVDTYKGHEEIVGPKDARTNTDPEPDLSEGFVDLYNGTGLDGWVVRGGHCTFEATPEAIVGTCVKGSPSTYLSTEREDYADFVFTAELKWVEDGNSGIMFRARRRTGNKGETVYGPQCEMEGFATGRGWSGGIYGQTAGGWRYPLWLEAHREVRSALREGEWNRVTIKAVGPTVKTWVNGIPAAHWVNDEFDAGLFGLQIHAGNQGEVHFRKIMVQELNPRGEDLFAGNNFSKWSGIDGGPVSGNWTIEDGVVVREGLLAGDIVTRKAYTNFDLRFDWKISKGGNSGVKYRTKGRLGLEYQVLDDANHRDGKDPARAAASLYDILPAAADKPLKPVGEWNQGQIVVRDNRIEHWLNGALVLVAEIGTDDWQAHLAASKFASHEGFGTWSGPILLQDHADKVWYRNVILTAR